MKRHCSGRTSHAYMDDAKYGFDGKCPICGADPLPLPRSFADIMRIERGTFPLFMIPAVNVCGAKHLGYDW